MGVKENADPDEYAVAFKKRITTRTRSGWWAPTFEYQYHIYKSRHSLRPPPPGRTHDIIEQISHMPINSLARDVV